MVEITIIHRIEAPELAVAINNLSDAIKGRPVALSAAPKVVAKPAPEMPVQAPSAPVATVGTVNPPPSPVSPTVNGAAPAAPSAAAPTPAPAPAPAETSAPKVYTFEDITAAGSQLLDQGKMTQLMELLKGYGVQAVTQLKPEQYADVAAGLRGLGAKI